VLHASGEERAPRVAHRQAHEPAGVARAADDALVVVDQGTGDIVVVAILSAGPVRRAGFGEGEAERAEAVVVVILLAGRLFRAALDREAAHHVAAVGEELAHQDDMAVVTGSRVGLQGEAGRQPLHPFHHRPHAVETRTLLPVVSRDLRLGTGRGWEGDARGKCAGKQERAEHRVLPAREA
jgi:hypothetical protein